MGENLKGLLEKINMEGVRKAEESARAIEGKAKAEAEKIMEDARKKAEKILEEASIKAEKAKLNGDLAIKQASRDLLLSLRDEIRKILNKVVGGETNRTLSTEETAGILHDLILKYSDKNGETSDIRVILKKEDLEKIRHGFMSRLKEKVKEGVEFKPSSGVGAGFYISFDKGKSYFDFTDEGLKETLCLYLNQELTDLIK
ncbi:MAG: hypothetical protein WC569_01800 [Candidatus Omnitrophota bacterium]